MLHGIHTMAQMRYILGEVATVYMREHKADSFQRTDLDRDDERSAYPRKRSLSFGSQTCESKMYGDLGSYVLHGENCSIRATVSGYLHFDSESIDSGFAQQSYPKSTLSAYALEIEAFADYVSGSSVGPTTGTNERRSLTIVQAGYESAQSELPVDLQERFGTL